MATVVMMVMSEDAEVLSDVFTFCNYSIQSVFHSLDDI